MHKVTHNHQHQQLRHTRSTLSRMPTSTPAAAQNKFRRRDAAHTHSSPERPPPRPPRRHAAAKGSTRIARGQAPSASLGGAEVLPVDDHEPLHAGEGVLLHLRLGGGLGLGLGWGWGWG